MRTSKKKSPLLAIAGGLLAAIMLVGAVTVVGAIMLVGAVTVYQGMFVVQENTSVVVTRWGKISKIVKTPGLNFKTPGLNFKTPGLNFKTPYITAATALSHQPITTTIRNAGAGTAFKWRAEPKYYGVIENNRARVVYMFTHGDLDIELIYVKSTDVYIATIHTITNKKLLSEPVTLALRELLPKTIWS